MIHALTLLCIPVFTASLVSHVPLAVLAGILMVVAYNMGEWREIPQPPVVILRFRNMTALDATGLFAIEEVAHQLQASNQVLILCCAREQLANLIHQAEFEEVVVRRISAATCNLPPPSRTGP